VTINQSIFIMMNQWFEILMIMFLSFGMLIHWLSSKVVPFYYVDALEIQRFPKERKTRYFTQWKNVYFTAWRHTRKL